MKKNVFFIIIIVIMALVISAVIYHKISVANNEIAAGTDVHTMEEESADIETNLDSDIVEISIEDVKGITEREAEKLCYSAFGDKDDDTGFLFSFGVSGAVERNGKQYYVIRVSWLVDNNHLSYIGDFFVSADGKQIYNGLAGPDGYEMSEILWSE